MASIEPSVIENFTPMVFEPGWARRPKRGDGKGASYILEYRQEIYDMFIAGELDKRQRKAPTQMLEVLQAAHPGVIALPGFSEISSFVGSLISRAKKGQTGLPAARAAPTPAAIKNAIAALDVEWSSEITPGFLVRGVPGVGHRIANKKFTVQDLYDEMKRRYTLGDPGILDSRFPEPSRFKSIVSTLRKLRKEAAAAGGKATVVLLRPVAGVQMAARVAVAAANDIEDDREDSDAGDDNSEPEGDSDSDPEYEVEDIRSGPKAGKYEIKWLGCASDENTWEAAHRMSKSVLQECKRKQTNE